MGNLFQLSGDWLSAISYRVFAAGHIFGLSLFLGDLKSEFPLNLKLKYQGFSIK
jgi:hypothetical protein